ncbi:MAG TPA: D-2-hydroxyacid dehydrogenase [Pirellulales bacterium]|nr:D-2-hydroxyacid dehydrogenase [Pirellulales bacterium]
MKLLISPAVEPARFSKIESTVAGLGTVVNAADDAQALAEMADADAFFGRITPALLARGERLRWIQAPTASMEHYLFPELVEHSAVLTNMRGLFNDCIADQVLGYITCFARNLHLYIRRQTSGRWEPVGGEQTRTGFQFGAGLQTPIDLEHRQLTGATLGIVGLGGIGAEIAARGVACHMRVVAVDPARTEPVPGMEALWPINELPCLLSESDYVVVAAPHTPETAGLFGRAQFQQMKPTAYFINIGRGAIVRLADLCAALRAKEIAGAALDVFEVEPLPPEHPLWQFDNVILTPHVAGMAPLIAERHLQVLLDNLRRFAQGKELLNIVDKRRWY